VLGKARHEAPVHFPVTRQKAPAAKADFDLGKKNRLSLSDRDFGAAVFKVQPHVHNLDHAAETICPCGHRQTENHRHKSRQYHR